MPDAKNRLRFLTPKPSRPDSPLFVFLPGMDGTGKLLRMQVPKLAEAFDIRCLAIPPDDIANWEILVNETVALIEKEQHASNRQRPIYLCGESFGGCLALKVALAAPHLLERLILVNPASSFRQQPWMQWGSYLTQWLPAHLYPLSVFGLLPALASLGKIEHSERLALLEAMQSVPQRTSIWRLALVRSFDVSEPDLHHLKLPVLIVASGADRLLPSVAEAKLLVKVLPNAQMAILANSGHACLLETDVDLYTIMKKTWGLGTHRETNNSPGEPGQIKVIPTAPSPIPNPQCPTNSGVAGVAGVAGVQKFRSSEVQEFRSLGVAGVGPVQEFRSSGVQEFRSSGVQEFESSGSRRKKENSLSPLLFTISALI